MRAASPLELVELASASDPERAALLTPGAAPLSWRHLLELLGRRTAELRQHGISRAHRIALSAPAGPAAAACSLTLLTGAVCAPLDPTLTAVELAERLAALRATHWVVPHETLSTHAAVAADLGLTLIGFEPVAGPAGSFTWHWAAERPGAVPADEGLALLLPTSGSTARPKIVPLSGTNVCAGVNALVRSLALGPRDRCLHALPLFHVGGLLDLLLAPLAAGGSVLVSPEPNGETLVRLLDEAPTWFQGVPAMLQDLLGSLKRAGRGPGQHPFRLLRSVSSSLPLPLRSELEAWFRVPVVEIYGMTETAGVITSPPLDPSWSKPGSVGVPVTLEVRIVDEAARVAAAGVTGEILVRGEAVTLGYEGEGEAGPDAAGWLATGDLGYLDEDGALFLVGRRKELINRGGEKIAPLEIDRAASSFAGVQAAASFGLPHPSWGEEVALAVQLESGTELDQAALLAHLSARLAPHKVPRRIFVVDELPRTASGKLHRGALPELVSQRTPAEQPDGASPSAHLTELALLELWRELLEVSEVGIHDDFFDLGGDSLRAATLVARLHEEHGVQLTGGEIFDYPTVAQLAARIRDQGGGQLLPRIDSPLPAEPLRELLGVLSAWSGVRPSPTSLLVGRNVTGPLRPLFWCGQNRAEPDHLARVLGPERPIWVMRSMLRLGSRSEENLRLLARHYAQEIRGVQSEGPYWLGGNCLGGKVAFHIAQELRRQGQRVERLFLRDHFEPEPYPGDVCLILPRANRFSPRHRFLHAERRWSQLYTGTLWAHDVQAPHAGYWEHDEESTRLLREHLSGRPPPPCLPVAPYTAGPLDPSALGAKLHATLPSALLTGAELTIDVRVTNESSQSWQPFEQSGLYLVARWTDRDGRPSRRQRQRVHVPLEAPLSPGATALLRVVLDAPHSPARWRLKLDLVEDGVAWLSEHGVAPLEGQIWVLPRLGQVPATMRRAVNKWVLHAR